MDETLHFEWLCDVVVHNAQQLIRNATKAPRWKYNPNKADFGSFRKFFEYYQERYRKAQMTDAFLIEYMNKQFEWMFYRDEVTEHKLNSVRLTWFFGAKAIARWEAKLAEKQQSSHTKFKKNGLALKAKSYKSEVDYTEVYDFEELEKSRFHNTEAGLIWCIENTNLFNQKSPFCENCIFASECKASLQLNYPAIYKLRNESTSQRTVSDRLV